MREIKFRAWNSVENTMVYQDEDNSGDYWDGVCCSDIEMANRVFKNKKYEWMQYTGLKDKNGVEIYEGDILKDDENFVWKVNYYPGQFVLECDDLLGVEPIHVYRVMYSEVIGNIYEHPHLLEVRNDSN